MQGKQYAIKVPRARLVTSPVQRLVLSCRVCSRLRLPRSHRQAEGGSRQRRACAADGGDKSRQFGHMAVWPAYRIDHYWGVVKSVEMEFVQVRLCEPGGVSVESPGESTRNASIILLFCLLQIWVSNSRAPCRHQGLFHSSVHSAIRANHVRCSLYSGKFVLVKVVVKILVKRR